MRERVAVEAPVVGWLFWPERFHEGVGFDAVAVEGEVGDELGASAEREIAHRGRRHGGSPSIFDLRNRTGGDRLGLLGIVGFGRLVELHRRDRRFVEQEGIGGEFGREPFEVFGGGDEIGDRGLLGGGEVASGESGAEGLDPNGVVLDVESPPVPCRVADDGGDGSAGVGDGQKPVRSFGRVGCRVEDDDGIPGVAAW